MAVHQKLSNLNMTPPSPQGSHTLRPASAEDEVFLFDVVRATMCEHVETTWGEWDENWQRSRFTERFLPERWKVILHGDQAIGGVCTEYRAAELYVANLHLLPTWQGHGIGTAVMHSLLANASARYLATVTLNVLSSNDGARRLYERLGFRVVTREEKRYWMEYDVPPSQPSV